jgi:hypothetical protein
MKVPLFMCFSYIYIFRNTHTTGKLKDIESDYEVQCEAKKVGFATWLVDLSCVSGFTLQRYIYIYIHKHTTRLFLAHRV